MKSDDDVICNNTIYVDDTTLYSMSKIVVLTHHISHDNLEQG